MKIALCRADILFSRIIRKRDGECVRCHSKVQLNDKGEPVSHQNSHYWGRGNWSVRFDPENCDTLCFYCHRLWGGDERRAYENFKRRQLGEREYLRLEIRKNAYAKRDRTLALMYVKELMKTL